MSHQKLPLPPVVDGWRDHRVREDFTVDDFCVETRIGIPDPYKSNQAGFLIDREFNYVEFTIDDGATDIAVRLPFNSIVDLANKITESKP
jgi:hypothetical protein